MSPILIQKHSSYNGEPLLMKKQQLNSGEVFI